MSEALEVVRQDNRVTASDPESIVRYALDHNASVDVIERMMAIRRELNAENAKRAFDDAMAAFQAECPIIKKTKMGAREAYKFAPLDDIVEQVRPLILRHGFSHRITSQIDPGWIKAICTITHRLGHSEPSEFKVPIDSRNTMMSDPQKYGGSMTFAKRYAFCNAFGILTADEDKDGNLDKPKPPGPSKIEPQTTNLRPLVKELWELLKDVRGPEKNWVVANKWLWEKELLDGAIPESAPDLSEKRFKEVIEGVKKLLSK